MENKYISYIKFNIIKYNLYDIGNISKNNDILNIINEILMSMKEYLIENITQFIYVDIYDDIFDHIYEVMFTQFISNNLLENIFNISNSEAENILNKCILISRNIVFKFIVPKRSYSKSYIRKDHNDNNINLKIQKSKIKKQLNILTSIVQPEQRTDEWYIFRNSTLTASNIWKIFISDYSQTQLILEKCQPMDISKFKTTNTNSPLHWGQKYEPVSVLYYEYINNTTVTDFGCIPHKDYSFIAASPDGIICDEESELYGRMLEIKNVVSREIDGIPKMEYWIQMQLQMEVCDLNECDFLETKFTEYIDEEDYLSDNEIEYKGIILQFLKNSEPHYEYAPFMLTDVSSQQYIDYYNLTMDKNKDLIFIKTIYWKLEKISNILVLRNKLWFHTILPYIETFWNNLVSERDSGEYKKRIKTKHKLEIQENKKKVISQIVDV